MKSEMPIAVIGRVVIAGGSGFLGQSLARAIVRAGGDVVVLSRRSGTGDVHWDARMIGDWEQHLDGAAAIVNLVGRSVDCIKTPDHCDEILRSRVESTKVLGEALLRIANRPKVWVQMSTAHIYGDPPVAVCDEDSAFGYGLAPIVGQAWEGAFHNACPPDVRKVILRTSFVMGRSGGALQTLAKIARFGLGGTIADGSQGMSWIHEDDMNRLFLRAINDNDMQGAYIATAPNPVSNKEFMHALRNATRRPFGLPAAAWMVRVAAPLLMRTDPELVLYGRYCVSKRLREEGFEFEHPTVEDALADLLNAREAR